MLTAPPSESRSPLKNPLVYSYAVVVVVVLAVAFVMYSRWHESRVRDQAAAAARAEKQRTQDSAAVEQLGGKEFAILDFYANPKAIRRGESAQLCYGVANAKTVQLEPQPSPVWPSVSHCVNVSPTKTTTYTLAIADAGGQSKSQTLDLVVR